MEHQVEVSSPAITNALIATLKMAFHGDEQQHGWYNGLLFALEGVSAERASRPPAPGRATVAAHAEHVRFTLQVVNAWIRGENPEVDWADSWKVQTITAHDWDALRENIRQEFETLLSVIQDRAVWREPGLTMMINNIGHTAYHASAIRQLLKSGAD